MCHNIIFCIIYRLTSKANMIAVVTLIDIKSKWYKLNEKVKVLYNHCEQHAGLEVLTIDDPANDHIHHWNRKSSQKLALFMQWTMC